MNTKIILGFILTLPFIFGVTRTEAFLNQEVTQEEIDHLRLQMDEEFKQEHKLDYLIVQACASDEELSFKTAYYSHYKGVKQLNWQRCALIGQAQIRMETKSCTIGMGVTRNNCFGIKNKVVSGDKTYSSHEESINDWVAHYYDRKTGDYKSTIHEIIYGYWMKDTYGDGQYKWMYGYATGNKKEYTDFVKNYYNENYLKMTDEYFGQS